MKSSDEMNVVADYKDLCGEFDLNTGDLRHRGVLIQVPSNEGLPDGLTVPLRRPEKAVGVHVTIRRGESSSASPRRRNRRPAASWWTAVSPESGDTGQTRIPGGHLIEALTTASRDPKFLHGSFIQMHPQSGNTRDFDCAVAAHFDLLFRHFPSQR